MSLVELVRGIALELVTDRDAVSVQEVPGDRATVLELRVAREDIGKIIGKEGRTAQSIRLLVAAAASKLGQRAHLDILD